MARNRPLFWISNFLLFRVLITAENNIVTKVDSNIVIFNEMHKLVDESVEPCQNFQKYSAKNIRQARPPPFVSKFIELFDDLKDKVFEDESLEGKMQRFYNICLADTSHDSNYHSDEAWTLQELEENRGRSLSKYLEYVYGHPIPQSAVVYVNSWNQLDRIKTLDSDVEPSDEIRKMFEIALRFPVIDKIDRCVKSVCFYLNIATNLLYEERVLSPKKVSQYQSQAKKIFEAIRHQFSIRLQRNSLNWTAAEISDLQESLNGLTLIIGNTPENVNHREFATEIYKDLHFSVEDDFEHSRQKVLDSERLKQVIQLEQDWGLVYRCDNNIIVPYSIMDDSAFELETHDIFRMAPLGTQLAVSIFAFFKPENCSRYSDSLIKMFDDYQICTENLFCPKQTNNPLATQQIILVIANLVHEAYFAPGSKFNKIQPSFTPKTLSQLSFLRLAQSVSRLYPVENELLTNLWPKLPSFGQAFNCSV